HNYYTCQCDTNYAMPACEVYIGGTDCDADDCLNGGLCSGGKCYCISPFTGTHCESVIPCDGYCLNGGTCSHVNNQPSCECPLNYSGQQCERVEKDKTYDIVITPDSQQLPFNVAFDDTDPSWNTVFTVCAWIRANPNRNSIDPVMPIFEMDFGGDKLRVTTSEATIGARSLGLLKLRMRVWQQFCIRCSSGLCVAYANGDPLNIRLDNPFYDSLGSLTIAPKPASGEEILEAEISRFSIFASAISEPAIEQFTFKCAASIVPGSAADEFWWSLLNLVPRSSLTSPGMCENTLCFPGSSSCEKEPPALDKSPPVATFCPPDIFMNSSRPMTISWTAPVFEDDVAVEKVESNYQSGGIFIWGEYHVVYTASDPSNNTGTCEFDIYLAPNVCKQPDNPAKGDVVYKNTFDGESGGRFYASVKCADERFPLHGPRFYVCDYMGQWRRSYYSPSITPPSCGEVSDPEQKIDGKVKFSADSYDCERDRDEMERRINIVLALYCPADQPGCAFVQITPCDTATVTPREETLIRAMLITNDDPTTLDYEIIIASTDPLIYQNVQSELEKGDDVDSVQTELPVLQCGTDTPRKFTSDGVMLCAEVPPGFYYSAAAQEQMICPQNEYQDKSNQGECSKCPEGTITIAEGATKISDCFENCSPGSYCEFAVGVGTSGAFDNCCTKCPIGQYTATTGVWGQCTFCKDEMPTHDE
ncbi:hypothetical protein PFISCL1PPCAC_9775, partial [Pristionchus fissidentatus]